MNIEDCNPNQTPASQPILGFDPNGKSYADEQEWNNASVLDPY